MPIRRADHEVGPAVPIDVADDGGGAVEISKETAMQLSDSPGAGAQNLVSLWQTESAALKICRYANWRRCRAGMAQVLDNVGY